MEFIVQRFRALASDVRIRIIRVLVVLGETSVNKLADATGIRP
ncbi:transcriptional regulator, partial [bacterium]|nr:transcriptional regulator [bacterium]